MVMIPMYVLYMIKVFTYIDMYNFFWLLKIVTAKYVQHN